MNGSQHKKQKEIRSKSENEFLISIVSSNKIQPSGRRLWKDLDEIRTYFLYS